jgi:3-dehydroquinate synthase
MENSHELASSMKNVERVTVNLGPRSYGILIGNRLLHDAGAHIAPLLKRNKVAIVSDENVARHHLATLEQSLAASGIASSSIVLNAGEPSKSFATLTDLCDQLLATELERRDFVIALGGGVIGDLTGFAAAIVRRGIGFIQIPTTLLAQVDSSVGGKTGINSRHGKNLIGAFYQPSLVLADLDALSTLPQRERAAGYAEVAKYGLLGDAAFFGWLEKNTGKIMANDAAATAYAVKTCCEAKARIVAEDETETGVRALLNLGHTFGHALESATGYGQTLIHGEAVSIGMVQAFRFSAMLGYCDKSLGDTVANHLKAAGLPVDAGGIAHHLPSPEKLVDIMRQDKKAQGGKLTFILTRGIGQAFVAKDVPSGKALAFLNEDLKRK